MSAAGLPGGRNGYEKQGPLIGGPVVCLVIRYPYLTVNNSASVS
jgi:hypothetical protein